MTTTTMSHFGKTQDLEPETNRVHRNGLIWVLILNALDLLTTYVALHFGAREGNPWLVWLVETKMIFVVKAVVVGGACYALFRKAKGDHATAFMTAAIWWVAGIYSLVVFMNVLTAIKYAGS